MKRKLIMLLAILLALAAAASFVASGAAKRRENIPLWDSLAKRESWERLGDAQVWQEQAEPGDLSRKHAFMGENCAGCHTAFAGPTDEKCIACHADNQRLLQKPTTRFHAEISRCALCHFEHRGASQSITVMDHVMLARAGATTLDERHGPRPEHWARAETGKLWFTPSPRIRPEELRLHCARCHQVEDPHRGYFGSECAACHETAKWSIPEFRHPSPNSHDCAQCHQAPPSHYMMHFKMVSMRIAGVEHANVRECFTCHKTTSWNDIVGVGFYKHH